MIKTIRRTQLKVAALGLLALVTGCSTAPTKPVEERAVQRWELLIAGKAGEAYDYLTPGYQAVKTKEVYTFEMSARPVKWTGVKYLDKTCAEPDVCTLRLEITFKIRMHAAMMGEVESLSVQSENWIMVRGAWHHLPEKLGAEGLR